MKVRPDIGASFSADGDLSTYRQKLAVLLKAQTGLNFSLLIGQINEEIALVEAGLARLNPAHSA